MESESDSSQVNRVQSSEPRRLESESDSSKNLCSLANDDFILKNLPLHHLKRCRQSFDKFMKRCRQSGNPEAIFRKGLIHYFHPTSYERQREKGLEQMKKAAEDGIEEARYVLGLVLLCLGGADKDRGLNIISSLLKEPMLSMNRQKLVKLCERNYVGWSTMDQLKGSYTKPECNCDGKTVSQNMGWGQYGFDNDIPLYSACNILIFVFGIMKSASS